MSPFDQQRLRWRLIDLREALVQADHGGLMLVAQLGVEEDQRVVLLTAAGGLFAGSKTQRNIADRREGEDQVLSIEESVQVDDDDAASDTREGLLTHLPSHLCEIPGFQRVMILVKGELFDPQGENSGGNVWVVVHQRTSLFLTPVCG